MDTASRVSDLIPLIDRWLAYQQWYRQIPSLAVGIAVGGRTLLAEGYGWADEARGLAAGPDVAYRIASHSKVFTATAVMGLVAQGRLRLDDPVSQHLAWFRSETNPELARVTVRHLLSHSSGLTRDGTTTHWHDGEFPDEDALRGQVVGFGVLEPVTALKYSNVAYAVAGLVIEAVTGTSYEAHVTEVLIRPLGLTRTTPDLPTDEAGWDTHATGFSAWRPDRPREAIEHMTARVMNSATGFSSTVNDLLRWYAAHQPGDDRLLDDHLKREMQRVQFESCDVRWGLGFQLARVADIEFRAHGGGYPGFITFSGFSPDHELVLVVLTNAIDGPAGEVFAGTARLIKRSLDGAFDPFVPAATGSAVAGPVTADDVPTTLDRDAVDRVTGFYPSRFRDTLVARVGERVVVLPPGLSQPADALQVLEPVAGSDGLRFRYPRSMPTASPEEELWFEPGDPPRFHGPAQPPLPRSDPWS